MNQEHKADPRILFPKMPQVVVDGALLRKLWTYCKACETELSGLGTIEVDEDNLVITVKEPFHLVNQSGSGGSTELDMEAVSNLVFDLMETGQDSAQLGFWYHTHVKMDAFFSMTDDRTIEKLSEWFPNCFLAAVGNHWGEMKWSLTWKGYGPVEWPYRCSKPDPTVREVKEVKGLVDSKVKKKWAWEDWKPGEWFRSSSTETGTRPFGFLKDRDKRQEEDDPDVYLP